MATPGTNAPGANASLLDQLTSQLAEKQRTTSNEELEMIAALKTMSVEELEAAVMIPIMEIAVRTNQSPFDAALTIVAKLPRNKPSDMVTGGPMQSGTQSTEQTLMGASKSKRERIIK